MSRPQPTRKQMIIQQVLLMAVVFLGINLFCNAPKAPPETRSATQIIGDIQKPATGAPPPAKVGETRHPDDGTLAWANASLLEQTAATIKGKVDTAIDQQEEKKKISHEEAERMRLHALILLADTQLKSGLARNDTSRIRSAFYTLANFENKHRDEALWTSTKFATPAPLAQPARYPWREWTGRDLYQKVVVELSAHNKNELVYGVFPGYQIVDFLVNLTGAQPYFSYAFAAFLLALLVRAVIYPVQQRQFMWSRKMQQLAPLVKEIKAQYTDKKTNKVTNQAELQQKTMALYQEYGINPLAGCLPMLLQWPLYLAVYQFMLTYQFQFQKGYFLWMNPNTSRATHGFFAPNLGLVDHTMIVIYGITMIVNTLLMPVTDPSQQKQQRLMGVGGGLLFTVFMFTGAFPTPGAFVVYWVFTNVLSTAQALRAYRLPMPPLEKVVTKAGGVFPMPGFNGPPSNNGTANGNGKANGKTPALTPSKGTGTPAKHKPKRRK